AARLFATLPARQRAALVMRFYERASYAEIAEVLGTAEVTARSLVHRALTSLRSTLQEGGDA
ncbi:MAG: SigE family RNA polymerase sigma factor, partial [Propionibacteriaceae bacterium]|nr:SigE family RNA polymerase sigma factor [Propionibacteriaceae bacterium]